jgi:serine/threonine protein kinase
MIDLSDNLSSVEKERLIARGIGYSRARFIGQGKNRAVYSTFRKSPDGYAPFPFEQVCLTVPLASPEQLTPNAIRNRSQGDLSANEAAIMRATGQEVTSIEGEGRTLNVTPYVFSGDLQTLIDREGPIGATKTALPIINSLLADLESLASDFDKHGKRKKKFVHRDIKPDNVFIGGEQAASLGDYELAGSVEDITNSDLPIRGTGTYAHRSLLNAWVTGQQAKATERTEVYSFGATLYEMLTGKKPSEYKIVQDTIGRKVLINGEEFRLSLYKGDTRITQIDEDSEERRIKQEAKGIPRWARDFVYKCLTDSKCGYKSFAEARVEFNKLKKGVENRKTLVPFLKYAAAIIGAVSVLGGVASKINPDYQNQTLSSYDRLYEMSTSYLDSTRNSPINGEEAE